MSAKAAGATWTPIPRSPVYIGSNIGLSEDESYELFKRLVDEGYIDPGRVYSAGGAMPGRTSRVVGRGDNMTAIGNEVWLTDKGQAETG